MGEWEKGTDWRDGFIEKTLKDGEECAHIACSHHVTKPCEMCGRYAARGEAKVLVIDNTK